MEQLRTGGCASGPLHRDQRGCIPHLRHHRVQRAGVLGRGPCSGRPNPRAPRRDQRGLLLGVRSDRGRRGRLHGQRPRPRSAARPPHGDQPRLGACVRHRRVGRGGVLGPLRGLAGRTPGALYRDQREWWRRRQLRVRAHQRRGGAVLERVHQRARRSARPLRRGCRGRRARLRTHRRRRGGVLGPPPRLARLRPDRSPPGRYAAISAGSDRTCAVTLEGAIVCWGDTDYELQPIPPL